MQRSLLTIMDEVDSQSSIQSLLSDDQRSVQQIIEDFRPNFKESLTILGIDPTVAYLGKRDLLHAIDSVICYSNDRGHQRDLYDYINEAAPEDEVQFKRFIRDLYADNRYTPISELLAAHRAAQTPEPPVEPPPAEEAPISEDDAPNPKMGWLRRNRVWVAAAGVLALAAVAGVFWLNKSDPAADTKEVAAEEVTTGPLLANEINKSMANKETAPGRVSAPFKMSVANATTAAASTNLDDIGGKPGRVGITVMNPYAPIVQGDQTCYSAGAYVYAGGYLASPPNFTLCLAKPIMGASDVPTPSTTPVAAPAPTTR